MELGKVKMTFFQGLGWLSIVLGLLTLLFINISLISGYQVPLMDNFSLLLYPAIISGAFSSFNKRSRSLGLWGLGLCAYIGLFIVCMFFLGWMVIPFP
ncbi:hypothetical protein [Ornithinibacillus halotolerans]|uniref:Uncharacterized protein n=1 Tax=Ornithinibacillus halotolerans TaxID=1274357 RepID=A0A916WEL5_9BACI|nr:hypothetical protein [Ornithinibacillus halotolerans]GGA90756.1 hypothetical protein GCM10008025_36590 [Ornithinibacillus halotolerans]